MANEKEFSKLEGNELEKVAGGKTYYLFDGREDEAAADHNSPFEILDEKGQTLYRCPTKDGAIDLFRSIHQHDELKVVNWREVQRLRMPEERNKSFRTMDRRFGFYGPSRDEMFKR